MPAISVVNSKGGSGKSTTTVVVGLALAEKGANVALIDADPNQPLVRWQGGSTKPIAVFGGIATIRSCNCAYVRSLQ